MAQYFHSVTLDVEKCKGCTNCIKRCPTEAIRVHDGKATIMEERCIDCGECIRHCPNHAKIALTDTMERLRDYKYRIALPAPSFFGQFKEHQPIEDILAAFLKLGFDAVFEVAVAAEVVGYLVHQHLISGAAKKPLLSSACPAVVRLLQTKFPDLLAHVAPVLSPMEVAARLAKEEAVARTGVAYEEIGAFFISPCAAKVTEMRNPTNTRRSAVNGVIGANLFYKDIIKHLNHRNIEPRERPLQRATNLGMAWGYVTGESRNVDAPTTLAVGGIQNVISLLEEIELGELKEVDFIELQACLGGCVGGPLNIQNVFVGRVRLRDLVKKYGTKEPYFDAIALQKVLRQGHFEATDPILPRRVLTLDEDVAQALMKIERIEKITEGLPGLDCGACGSPSCRALAEDIVRGIAFETDCVINLRERVKTLAEEILDLARIMPHAMSGSVHKKDEEPGE